MKRVLLAVYDALLIVALVAVWTMVVVGLATG